MSNETQPLLTTDVEMHLQDNVPSPRDKALESFKRKLIEHREYDNKLKNRNGPRFLVQSHS